MWNRRDWIRFGLAGPIAGLRQGAAAQTFLAGVSAGVQDEEGLRRLTEELARLGIRYLESSGGGIRLADLYAGREAEIKDEFDRRNLKLAGYAQYSMMGDATRRQELIELHLRIARFAQPLGARYITQLWTPLSRKPVAEDYRNFAANVNEVGRRVLGETGLGMGFHAEREDVVAGMLEPVMESSDPRFFGLVADVGHFQAGGLDQLAAVKKYRSRIIAIHLRDFDPMAQGRGAFVPLGQGVIKLAALIAYLRETSFTGSVNAEGGVLEANRDYMVQRLGLEL